MNSPGRIENKLFKNRMKSKTIFSGNMTNENKSKEESRVIKLLQNETNPNYSCLTETKKSNTIRRIKNKSLIDFSDKNFNMTQNFHSIFKKFILSPINKTLDNIENEGKRKLSKNPEKKNLIKLQTINLSPNKNDYIETETSISKLNSPMRTKKISNILSPIGYKKNPIVTIKNLFINKNKNFTTNQKKTTTQFIKSPKAKTIGIKIKDFSLNTTGNITNTLTQSKVNKDYLKSKTISTTSSSPKRVQESCSLLKKLHNKIINLKINDK